MDFSFNIAYAGSWKWGKKPTNSCFGLHIYLRANKTLIYNSLNVLDNWRKNLSHKKYNTITARKSETGWSTSIH